VHPRSENPGYAYGDNTDAVLRWGREGANPSLASPNLRLQQQYAVVKPVNSYTGGVLEGWSD